MTSRRQSVRVVPLAAVDRAVPVEASRLMNIMPILSRRRSASIRHNIAQDCQERNVGTPRQGILAYRNESQISHQDTTGCGEPSGDASKMPAPAFARGCLADVRFGARYELKPGIARGPIREGGLFGKFGSIARRKNNGQHVEESGRHYGF